MGAHGDGFDGRERPGADGAQAPRNGPVIKQRDTALPDRPVGTSKAIVSIAPDGLEAFARDLRAMRAKAELDYPEMAERSHYTMKTLASAAGGLRLPTLPVAIAFVKACDGNEAEWEDRWHKLAAKFSADAAKKHGDDAPEPGEAEPAPQPQTQTPPPDSGAVYVITSAKPRQPDW